MSSSSFGVGQSSLAPNVSTESPLITARSNLNTGTQDYVNYSATLVEKFLQRDERQPDIYDTITACETQYDEIFTMKQVAVLPEPLFEQYNNLEYKCFMGIFTEINRAWVTIDNKFYIWNYLDGSDFNEYDELDQVIISAGLVVPKPGVFKDYVKYLLVLATPVEVVLVAVTFTNSTSSNKIDFSEINLLPTNYSIASDNVNMLKIIGTPNGRIFLCGKDGCLYELTYDADDGWFRRKCRKLNHSQSLVGILIPSFLKFTSDVPIIDMIIDNKRNILYTLSQMSTIEVYDLGYDGASMKKVTTYSSIIKDAQRLSRQLYDSQSLKLIHIAAIIDESAALHLVGISSKGDRFFFTTNTNGLSQYSRPSYLSLVAIRPTPLKNHGTKTANNLSIYQAQNDIKLVHECFYNKGVFILADAMSDDIDNLVCVSLESRNSNKSHKSSLTETLSSIEVQGKSLSIAEIPQHRNSLLAPRIDTSLNELSTQHIFPPREFICLSNNAIHLLSKLRPIDKFRKLLQRATESENMKQFLRHYGEEETCSMSLMISCSSDFSTPFQYSALESSKQYIADSQLAEKAEQIFLRYTSDVRHIKNTSTTTATTNAPHTMSMGGPILSSQDMVFSAAHAGTYIYFSRLIRPLWKSPIVNHIVNAQKEIEIKSLRFGSQIIQQIELSLFGLRDFLERHPDLYSLPPTSLTKEKNILRSLENSRDNPEIRALKQQTSFNGLYNLNIRCLQVLAFISLLERCDLEVVLKNSSQTKFKKLATIEFRDLVLRKEGEIFMKELIRMIVAKGSISSVKELCDTLRQHCGTYFNDRDLLEYKAFELLQQAKSKEDPEQRELFLRESLKIYLEIAAYINVPIVCREFQRLQFYAGVVDLALQGAEQMDPNNIASEWVSGGSNPQDATGKIFFENRLACYKCVLRVMDELMSPAGPRVTSPLLAATDKQKSQKSMAALSREDKQRIESQIMNKIKKSKDLLFHETVYRWFIEKGLQADLLKIQTPYLEHFLTVVQPDLDLLYRYYLQNERYDKAASILSTLAEKPDPNIQLDHRILYLSRAIGSAKAAPTGMGETLQNLQDRLEVANVQRKTLLELEAKTIELLKNEISEEEQRRLSSATSTISTTSTTSTRQRTVLGLSVPTTILDTPRVKERLNALHQLNSSLLKISELYNNYAQRFRLHESCLRILHCSEYKDDALVQQLWANVIETVRYNKGDLENKMKDVGKDLHPSRYFPVEFLCSLLELHISETGEYWDELFVVKIMKEIGVNYSQLYRAYRSMYEQLFRNQITQQRKYALKCTGQNKTRILSILSKILEFWLSYVLSSSASTTDRKEFPREQILKHLTEYGSDLTQFSGEPITSATNERIIRSKKVLQ